MIGDICCSEADFCSTTGVCCGGSETCFNEETCCRASRWCDDTDTCCGSGRCINGSDGDVTNDFCCASTGRACEDTGACCPSGQRCYNDDDGLANDFCCASGSRACEESALCCGTGETCHRDNDGIDNDFCCPTDAGACIDSGVCCESGQTCFAGDDGVVGNDVCCAADSFCRRYRYLLQWRARMCARRRRRSGQRYLLRNRGSILPTQRNVLRSSGRVVLCRWRDGRLLLRIDETSLRRLRSLLPKQSYVPRRYRWLGAQTTSVVSTQRLRAPVHVAPAMKLVSWEPAARPTAPTRRVEQTTDAAGCVMACASRRAPYASMARVSPRCAIHLVSAVKSALVATVLTCVHPSNNYVVVLRVATRAKCATSRRAHV